jgi:phage shock protein PspC (stress-responsive transcriptional regulator)
MVREPDDRKIAGVCSGLADAVGVDVTVVRVATVVLALMTPLVPIGYLIASVVVPERRPDQSRVRAGRVHLGRIPHPLIVVVAIVAVAALVDDAWWLNPFPAAVALVGIGVWLIVDGRNDAPDGPPGPAGTTYADGPPGPAGTTYADGPPGPAGAPRRARRRHGARRGRRRRHARRPRPGRRSTGRRPRRRRRPCRRRCRRGGRGRVRSGR